jgi:predicted molibdopterin-dependent oxidoreductase YjgC
MCHEVVSVSPHWALSTEDSTLWSNLHLEGKLEDAGCISCGNCISVCPTGALQAKVTQSKSVPVKVDKVTTTCPYCGVGCQMDLQIKGNKVVGIMPAFGASNEGILCASKASLPMTSSITLTV